VIAGAQRVGIEPWRDQPLVQSVGFGSPSLIAVFRLVEAGVGTQRVKLAPGQLTADGGDSESGVRIIAASVQ
jgi:hypothetical protein